MHWVVTYRDHNGLLTVSKMTMKLSDIEEKLLEVENITVESIISIVPETK